jgi:hypothetical protein
MEWGKSVHKRSAVTFASAGLTPELSESPLCSAVLARGSTRGRTASLPWRSPHA